MRFEMEYFLKVTETVTQCRPYTIVGVVVVLLSILWMRHYSRKKNYPPGPWGLPIVGHVPFLGKDPAVTLEKYRQKYGDVFSIMLGSYPTVVLSGAETIKAALTQRPDDFGGRPLFYSFQVISDLQGGNIGLNIPFGPRFKILRKVTNTALRTFANYRNNPIEDIVAEEGNRLVYYFLSKQKELVNPTEEIMLCVASVIYQVLFGRNSNIREDRHYCKMIQSTKDFTEFSNVGNPVDILPWTRIFFQGRTNKFLRIIEIPYKVLQIQQEEHLGTYDSDSPRDVMDSLLKSARELSRDEKRDLDVSEDLVMSTTVDLLGAGGDTVGTSLLWAIFYMTKYPEIQEKVHREIDQHVGSNRSPTMDDKKNLKLVEATILESMRMASVAPLSVPRMATVDVSLGQYVIPEGTVILVNQFSTCRDPKIWGDPDNFRPERFLSTDLSGEITVDNTLAESFLTFGAGRRRCIGEFLAKVEIFLFFTILMQRCTFSQPEGEQYSGERVVGLTAKPKPYRVVVEERK